MLISKKLIKKYLHNFDSVSNDQFINACSNLTFEVEEILSHPKLSNFVVGKINSVSAVQNSKKLHYVNISYSKNKNTNVVCGATNVKKGKKIVLALTGAKLYDGQIIEKKSILNYESAGMICAYSELTPFFHNLLPDNEKDCIIKLNCNDNLIGSNKIDELLNLDDIIFDLSLPTNRNDLSGALFLIDDLSKYINGKQIVKIYENSLPIINEYKITLNNELSSFFLTGKLSIQNNSTPWNFRKNLLSAGIKIENNFYDYFHWLTYLTGVAPLIFNSNNFPKQIIQRFAKKGEKITINNETYELNTSDVVLASIKNEIIALDGIAVDDKYSPQSNDKNVIFYVSNLAYAYPRNSTIALNINTFTSKYSKYQLSKMQLNNFIYLLPKFFKQIFVSNNFNDIKSEKYIDFNIQNAIDFIDKKINKKQIQSFLKLLGYKFKNNKVNVPKYRFDLQNQYDIIEEIVKIYGIDKLPSDPINLFENADFTNSINQEFDLISNIKNLLVSKYNFYETKTYNLVSQKALNQFNIFNYDPYYRLNPCSNKAREYMRLSLIDNMIKVMQLNKNYKLNIRPIFEIQKIYSKENNFNLTCITPKELLLDPINNSKLNLNTFGLKQVLNNISQLLNISFTLNYFSDSKYLYPNDNIQIIYNNQIIGYIGCIKSSLLKEYKLEGEELYLLTLNLSKLIKDYKPTNLTLQSIVKAPFVDRDITFNANSFTNIESIIISLNKLSFIQSYHFTKAYKLTNNDIAYTIHLELFDDQNHETLQKEKIDSMINVIIDLIKNNKGEIKQ